MADDLFGLADLVKINDQNLADLEITDLLDDAPFLAALDAEPASNGTDHKYLKETGAPVVGFRAPNTGRDHDHSDDTLVTIALKILDASFHVDKALADAYMRGGPDAMVAREARRHLKAAFFMAEKQLINGVGNDALGFVGLVDAATLNQLADAMVVDGGGSSGQLSSVFLVRTNADGTDCTAIMGQDGEIKLDDTIVQFVDDADGKKFAAYCTPIQAWLGLQIGSLYSVGRIANLDDGSSKLTDDLIYMAYEKFPSARKPNLLVMNRRSVRQLQQSRTASNPTGAPAPWPTDVQGIRIVETDGVLNSETQVT